MKPASLLLTRSARLLRLCLLLVVSVVFGTSAANAQGVVPCPPNVDFENGDYSNWLYYTGSCTTGTLADGVVFTTPTLTGQIANRHQLMTGVGVDAFGGFPVVPSGGGSFSMRIGEPSKAQYTCERIRYYVHVPVGFNDYSFNFRFATVLQNGGHGTDVQPAFRVKAFDSATNADIPCAQQNYIASPALIDLYGFKQSPVDPDVYYLPWTGGALPLIGQGGKTIVVEVTALDCSQSGHWGYGYFDVVSCGKYRAAVTYCNLDSGVVRFVGTGVTQDYNWYTSKWQFLGKGPYIDVTAPATPDFFYGVLANGIAGCLDTIVTDTVSNFLLDATPPNTCVVFGKPIQLEARTTGGIGGFRYSWTQNAELSALDIANPIASPKDTTRYYVTVADKRGCFRRDSILVKEAPDAGVDIPVCPKGDRPAPLFVNGPRDVTYNWTDLDGSPAKYLSCDDCIDPISRPEELEVFYTVGYAGCAYRDTIRVFIDTTNSIVTPQDPILVCRPSFIQLQSIINGPNPRQNLPCGTSNTVACAAADQDTANVGYGLIPPRVAMNTPIFKDSSFSKYQFIVKKADLFRAGFYSGTINTMRMRTLNTPLNNTTAIGLVTIGLACVDYDTMPVVPTNASFANTTTVATLNNYTVTAGGWNQFDFSSPYNWDTTKNILVDICITHTRGTGAGSFNEPLAMVPGNAIQKFSNSTNICGANAIAQNIRRYYQQPVVQFIHCRTPDLPFRFTWRPGEFVSDSTAQNPSVYVQDSLNLVVYSVGRNGCQLYDSLRIFHPEHDLSLQPQDTFICKGQPAYMRASGGEEGYAWYEFDKNTLAFSDASGSLSCTDCPTPTATPLETTTYAVVYSNNIGVANPLADNFATGCPDTLFTTVNVWELPNVRINAADTTIKYGQSVPLYAQGAARYTWTPSGSLSNPNGPAPIASPEETTNYVLTGIDSNGCSARDTVTITIDYHNNLLVPTAFTPNGDGRNDEFKVVNLSFQRLLEFRVFNRWGQEVFNTTDINKGWNGTWKGVNQEMGSYQYLIRVGIPDGNTETYKGDVTLIR
jgi:gliding motility-associated-like protein